MSRDVTQTTLDLLDDSVIYPFFAIELLFDVIPAVEEVLDEEGNVVTEAQPERDGVLRLWTGQGTLGYQGVSWYGTGNLLAVDTIEETSEIAAKGATVTLSGVPSEVLSLALSEPYQGRKAKIYFGTFQPYGGLLQEDTAYILLQDGGKILLEDRKTDLTEIFAGYMDQMNIDEGEGGSTVTLTIENKLIDLEKPRTARFTSTYQRTLFPNDKGLEFVEDLQTKEIVWGRTVE